MARDVSVVVPARNAAATIPKLFAALDDSTFAGDWEVIVVDDRSTDDTPALAEAWGARVVRLPEQSGPARARNAGIDAAAADLIAFTDADCAPAAGWLSAIVHAAESADLVTGPIVPMEPASPFARTLRITDESPLFETANLAVTRELAQRLGGFVPFAPARGETRPGLRPTVDQGHFGEDALFGWKARRAGARIAFVRDAVVYHAVFPRGPRGYIAERWRLRYFPTLVRELPELRVRLTLRFFLSPRSALFDLAVAGVATAVCTGRRRWWLAAAPYAWRFLRGRELWRRSVARQNLALITGDAVGLVALVRGSLAARRILL